MKKIQFYWNELKATFWFVPGLILICSILLSILLLQVEGIVDYSKYKWLDFFLVSNPDSARTILATISGAMIGVAGTVFSVTLVALTLASSQFGSRMIKNFMYIRLNQIVLGSYISTFLYCLLILNAVQDNDSGIFTPSISILFAIFAAIVNIVLLIMFIHGIATSIQADSLISDIATLMAKQVKALFPNKLKADFESLDIENTDDIKFSYQFAASIKSPTNGYLQYIDNESLMDFVTKNEALFVLNYRSGKYLVKDLELGKIYTNTKMDLEISDELLYHFVIGDKKTTQQDLEFSVHQLVEIALRALSPGINDPYTAVACIDNLTAMMCSLAKINFPSKYQFDEKNNLKMISKALTFEGVLDAAFNQIRQFSEDSPAIMIRLMEGLITISHFTIKDDQKEAVLKHAKMILRLGERSIKEENDLNDLKKRAEKLLN